MIRYIEKGDIFRIDGVSSYAHGCNCAGAMGKRHCRTVQKANIQICILNISSCAKKISFAPVMFLIMIMAMDIYITLVLKQRGEHELK